VSAPNAKHCLPTEFVPSLLCNGPEENVSAAMKTVDFEIGGTRGTGIKIVKLNYFLIISKGRGFIHFCGRKNSDFFHKKV
jgi:hypothetical protein